MNKVYSIEIVENGYILIIENYKTNEMLKFVFPDIEDLEDCLKLDLSKFCVKERYGYHEQSPTDDDIPF